MINDIFKTSVSTCLLVVSGKTINCLSQAYIFPLGWVHLLLIVAFRRFQHFLCRRSCSLWINIVHCLPCQSGCLLFLCFDWHRPAPAVRCGASAARGDLPGAPFQPAGPALRGCGPCSSGASPLSGWGSPSRFSSWLAEKFLFEVDVLQLSNAFFVCLTAYIVFFFSLLIWLTQWVSFFFFLMWNQPCITGRNSYLAITCYYFYIWLNSKQFSFPFLNVDYILLFLYLRLWGISVWSFPFLWCLDLSLVLQQCRLH